jgi:hypothetical protein
VNRNLKNFFFLKRRHGLQDCLYIVTKKEKLIFQFSYCNCKGFDLIYYIIFRGTSAGSLQCTARTAMGKLAFRALQEHAVCNYAFNFFFLGGGGRGGVVGGV